MIVVILIIQSSNPRNMDCEEREEKVDEELPQDSDLESGGWLLPEESSMAPMTLRRVSRMVIPATVTFAVVMFMTSTMAKVVSINTSKSVAHGETSFLEEVIRMPPNPLKSAGEEDLMKALDSFLTMVGADLDDDLVEDPVTPGEISSRRLQGFGRKIRAGPWLKRAFKQASTEQQEALSPFATRSLKREIEILLNVQKPPFEQHRSLIPIVCLKGRVTITH